MDVIFDWELGNMIYNGLITHRLYGFPFAEIRSFHVAEAWIQWCCDPDEVGPPPPRSRVSASFSRLSPNSDLWRETF